MAAPLPRPTTAIANAASPAYIEGQECPLSVDLQGRLRSTAVFTGTVTVNLNINDDEVMVGNTADGGTTRVLAKGDASGRFVVTGDAAAPAIVAVTNTADAVVKAGDAVNNAIRVNIVAGAGSGGTSATDKSTFTEGTSLETPIGGVYNETISADPTEDQTAAVRITAKRGMHVNLRDSSGVEISPAKETGGNLADIKTAVQIMDDWDESDRAKVNPIVGQAGVAAGAGAVDVLTQRTTLASDDPAVSALGSIKTAVEIMDDWDESDRAKVNIVVGQAGVTAGAGAVAANTPRVTLASDDPAVTSLQVMDDWDESDRAKVNIIAGQAGIAAGAGVVGVTVPRVTLASDDPAVTALQVMDDWDSNDRAKVSPIAGQDGIAAGAGAVDVLTPRVTMASDSPDVTALGSIKTAVEIMDDWDESDRAKVNVIAGQAGIAAGAGVVGVTVPRVTLASDDPAVTSLQIMDDWDESDRAKVNIITGQAGVTAGAGAVAANTPRTTLASDDPAVTSLQIMDDWDESDRAKVNPIAGQAGVQGASGVVTALTQRVVLATDVALPAGTNLLGRVNPEPQTANGCSTASAIGAASDNATVVKASAGNVYGVVCFNKNAAPVYLKLYNKATSPTNGDTPVKRYMVPGNTAGAGFVITHPMGISFATGIAYRLVTGIADNDNTSPTASEQLVNIDYK